MRTALALVALSLCGNLPAVGQQCQLNANPSCSAASNVGTVSGDGSAQRIDRTGVGEAFYRVQIRETAMSTRPLTARIDLTVPAGQNYDLIVRCASCASSFVRTSGAGSGQPERIFVSRPDTTTDNSFEIYVEVRYVSGTTCSNWNLAVVGNVGAVTSPLECS